jgi:hypothetical protein
VANSSIISICRERLCLIEVQGATYKVNELDASSLELVQKYGTNWYAMEAAKLYITM